MRTGSGARRGGRAACAPRADFGIVIAGGHALYIKSEFTPPCTLLWNSYRPYFPFSAYTLWEHHPTSQARVTAES